jgi:putative NADH-flavin reductase
MSAITIYGSTGMVGHDIAQRAVERGHRVTGVSRSSQPGNTVEGVTYVSGDLAEATDVVAKAEDADIVVISVPGPRDGSSVQPIIDAHAALIPALAASSVAADTRFFVVGGAGATLTEDGTRLMDTPDFPEAFKAEAQSFSEILDLYKAAPENLDWVMLAPAPEIGPGPAAVSYNLGGDNPAGAAVTTGTFATATLDELESPAHRRERFTVADA